MENALSTNFLWLFSNLFHKQSDDYPTFRNDPDGLDSNFSFSSQNGSLEGKIRRKKLFNHVECNRCFFFVHLCNRFNIDILFCNLSFCFTLSDGTRYTFHLDIFFFHRSFLSVLCILIDYLEFRVYLFFRHAHVVVVMCSSRWQFFIIDYLERPFSVIDLPGEWSFVNFNIFLFISPCRLTSAQIHFPACVILFIFDLACWFYIFFCVCFSFLYLLHWLYRTGCVSKYIHSVFSLIIVHFFFVSKVCFWHLKLFNTILLCVFFVLQISTVVFFLLFQVRCI